MVTKYAGGVVKGFALIAGIVVTGVAQWVLEGKALQTKDYVAVILVSFAIYLHGSFPPSKTKPLSTSTAHNKEVPLTQNDGLTPIRRSDRLTKKTN